MDKQLLNREAVIEFYKSQENLNAVQKVGYFSDHPENDNFETVLEKITIIIPMEALGQAFMREGLKKEVAEHIVSLNIQPEVIQGNCSEDEYLSLVGQIASNHNIKMRFTDNNRANLVSFASKYCGHHNQRYPFYDKLAYLWLKDCKYNVEYHDYPLFVSAFKKLRDDIGVSETEFTLRQIEYYVWCVMKTI